ncbi:MAG: hypothetical protein ACD_38C00112G0001 [uncultured bacterium]|nr:MAG: hypothetical protein ACD_38C00112G0001 [uncultured bacterium]
MTQLGADGVAKAFLGSSWGRYKDVMNHPEITYEKYLVLLQEGKGNIEILDSTTKKPVLIDPRRGFSFVMTGDETYDMPLRWDDLTGLYYGSDETGRFMWVENGAYSYHATLSARNMRNINTLLMVSEINRLSLFTIMPDKCMRNESIRAACPELSDPDYEPDYMNDIFGKFWDSFIDFNTHKSDDPLFTLK